MPLPPPYLLLPLIHLAAVTVPLVRADLRELRLPNALVLPGLVVTGWGAVWGALTGCGCAWWGVAVGSTAGAVLGAGWVVGAVGMGDVKLGLWLGSLGGMTGAVWQTESLAVGMLGGGVVVGAQVAGGWAGGWAGRGPVGREHLRAAGVRHPLGPALLAAFWAAMLGSSP